MSGVPQAVVDAIEFRGEGHEQAAIGWSRGTWVSWLPRHEDLLRRLENPLGRKDLTKYFTAIVDEATAVDAFVAAMVWGYGPVGYGAWRTHRILTENDDVGRRLQEIHEKTKAGGGPAGFRFMADNRLRHLGVAFGTKYLFFSAESARTDVRAPVLDRIVRAWLAANTDLELDIWSWRLEHYELYCTRLAEWGKARGLDAGGVEEAIFEYATRGPRTWQAPTTTPRELVDALCRLVDVTTGRSEEERAAADEALDVLSDFFGEN